MSETNKANTVAFHKKAVFEADVENAFRIYAGDPYRQHNPLIEDGKEGLRKFVAPIVRTLMARSSASSPTETTSFSTACGMASRTIRAAKPSLTSTGSTRARWSSTGM